MADQLELPEFGGDPDAGETDENPETGERAEPTDGPDDASLAVAARHALHDEELLAAYAAGTLRAEAADEADEDELARARALVDRCAVCRDLHADLVAITAAHRSTADLVVAVPRDFRLAVEDAERLRPGVPLASRAAPVAHGKVEPPVAAHVQPRPSGSLFDRLAAALGTAARPLGGTLVAAGLVGVLVGSFSLTALQAGSVATSSGAYGPNPAPTQAAGREDAVVPGATADALHDGDAGPDDLAVGSATPDPRIVLLGGSIGLVVIGILVLAISRSRARDRR